MTILNLYAGIGGNRKLWGSEHQITAIEKDERIASIYKDLYPDDNVIIGDAHEYLLKHYAGFDFIWSSPPCPTHSRTNFFQHAKGIIRYPDMTLYQEIILLQIFYKGFYCIENVKSYYDPLIYPQKSGRHYFWSNFNIPKIKSEIRIPGMTAKRKKKGNVSGHQQEKEIFKKMDFPDLSKYKYPDKFKLLRNCVDPLIGKAILDKAVEITKERNVEQIKLNF